VNTLLRALQPGDAMHTDDGYRQLLFKLAEAGQTKKKRIKFRETLDTAILGTMSTFWASLL
jgi:hypothetical protein